MIFDDKLPTSTSLLFQVEFSVQNRLEYRCQTVACLGFLEFY